MCVCVCVWVWVMSECVTLSVCHCVSTGQRRSDTVYHAGDFLSEPTDRLLVSRKIRHESGRRWLSQGIDLYDPQGHWPWEPDAAAGSAPPPPSGVKSGQQTLIRDTVLIRATTAWHCSLTQAPSLRDGRGNLSKQRQKPINPPPTHRKGNIHDWQSLLPLLCYSKVKTCSKYVVVLFLLKYWFQSRFVWRKG